MASQHVHRGGSKFRLVVGCDSPGKSSADPKVSAAMAVAFSGRLVLLDGFVDKIIHSLLVSRADLNLMTHK